MLQELHIQNFVLIDELILPLAPGLNVLSGETGAGKSIIVDAMALIAGERWQAEYARNPEKASIVEAIFDIRKRPEIWQLLNQYGLAENPDDPLLVSRVWHPGGRSWARINGQLTSLKFLRTLACLLLDMHGQEERLKIFTPELYLDYIDAYIPAVHPLKSHLHRNFTQLQACKKQKHNLSIDEKERLQQIDFLDFQIQEIEQAQLQPQEDEELKTLAQRINSAAELKTTTMEMLKLLYENPQQMSAGDQLYEASKIAVRMNNEPLFQKMSSQLENLYYEVQALAQELIQFHQQLDFDPELLEETESRLHLIYQLNRKYGGDLADVLQYLAEARQKRDQLLNLKQDQQQLQQEIDTLYRTCLQTAQQISELRRPAAAQLQEQILIEARALELKNLRFEIELNPDTEFLSATGIDHPAFLFSANPGESLLPIEKTASGGEKSRFILACKKALADQYRTETLIFDEIDSGLGGAALNAMATQIHLMAKNHQILLVTHAPQIAAYAQQHYYIEKKITNEHTFTQVNLLRQEEREREIARMLGGDNYSDIILQHARELLKSAAD